MVVRTSLCRPKRMPENWQLVCHFANRKHGLWHLEQKAQSNLPSNTLLHWRRIFDAAGSVQEWRIFPYDMGIKNWRSQMVEKQ
jgi:hypothetical protein